MLTPGRPTVRCVRDDIDIDWDSPGDRRFVDDLGACPTPLHRLRHRIIRKAADDFPASGDSDVRRESISGLSDPMWWKVRVGSRWRGAVYVDETGQAWLCAAGYRREGEATDFYKQFMASVNSNGAAQFLPTEEDLELLKNEIREFQFVQWEAALQEMARDWANEARGAGSAAHVLAGPDAAPFADVSLTFETVVGDDGEEGIADLYIEFVCTDWASAELLEWAESVILATLDKREQNWQPSHIRNGRAYSIIMAESEIVGFYAAMEEPSEPGMCVPGQHSHYAHRERLTQSTVEGDAVRALCGVWFVPRQDHAGLDQCPTCTAIHRQLPV